MLCRGPSSVLVLISAHCRAVGTTDQGLVYILGLAYHLDDTIASTDDIHPFSLYIILDFTDPHACTSEQFALCIIRVLSASPMISGSLLVCDFERVQIRMPSKGSAFVRYVY